MLAAYRLVVVAAAVIFIVETLPAHRPKRGEVGAGARYRVLFRDRRFVAIALVSGMVFSGLFAYLTRSPFLFQDHYSFTPQQYGLLFAVNSVVIVLGVPVLTDRPAHRAAVDHRVRRGRSARVRPDHRDRWYGRGGILGNAHPLWFFITCCVFCFPCTQAIALAHHGSQAGTAASVLGAANFGIAGLLSPLIGLFSINISIPMG